MHKRTHRLLLALFVFVLSLVLAGCGGSGSTGTHEEILVGSSANGKILRYDATTGAYLGVFAEGGPLVSPNGMDQLPNGDVAVGDFVTKHVLIYSRTGVFKKDLGALNGIPFGLLALSNGDLLISEHGDESANPPIHGRVVKYTEAGGYQTFIQDDHLKGPDGLLVAPDGTLLVSSQDSFQVLKYNATTGAYIGVFAQGAPLGPPNAGPSGIEFGPDGNLYVAQHDTNPVATTGGMVLRFNGTTGAFTDQVVPEGTQGLSGPIGVAFNPLGQLLVTSAATNQVLRFETTGQFAGQLDPTSDLQNPIYLTLVRR